jgi:hypothetical protein
MSKRAALWLGALAIIGFAFLAAVNASRTSVSSLGIRETCGGFDNLDEWFDMCDDLLAARLAVLLIGGGIAVVPIYLAEKEAPARRNVGNGIPTDVLPRLVGGHRISRDGLAAYRCREAGCSFNSASKRAAHSHQIATGGVVAPSSQGRSARGGEGHEMTVLPNGLFRCDACSYTTFVPDQAESHETGVVKDATGTSSMVGPLATVDPPRPDIPVALSGSATPSPAEFKTCPDCAEEVRAAARKCRFCGYAFSDVSAPA